MDFENYSGKPQDKNLPVVEFYHDTVEDGPKSKKEGRPIYRDVEMVKIIFPADRQRTLVRPAHAEWKKMNGKIITYAIRFNEQYKRFKANDTQVVSGTPLSEAPFLTQAQRLSLKALGVYTIEQLASLTGQPLKNIGMSGLTQVEQAKAYLENAKGSADTTRLAADNAALRKTIEQMQAAAAQEKRGPGRPRKTEAQTEAA